MGLFVRMGWRAACFTVVTWACACSEGGTGVGTFTAVPPCPVDPPAPATSCGPFAQTCYYAPDGGVPSATFFPNTPYWYCDGQRWTEIVGADASVADGASDGSFGIDASDGEVGEDALAAGTLTDGGDAEVSDGASETGDAAATDGAPEVGDAAEVDADALEGDLGSDASDASVDAADVAAD